ALGIPISEVHIQTEKTMAYHSEYHGVRLDVYAADADRTRFNVEMQITLQKFLPKRSRYYHDQIDMDALLSGDSYENLPDTYVIFICDFDPFGDGLYRYSTRTFCEETRKPVNDGIETVYLNAHGRNRDSIPDELLQFLDYVKDTGRTETISTTDSFVRRLQNTIDAIKQNRSMEERYMLLEEMMRNEKQEGIQQGSQQMLVQCLVDFLESKFSVSDTMMKKNESETDLCKLQACFQLSLKMSSIEEFEKNM
ncbi:MAG: Rpn family recombination-promoting nuclease/putative transposase, partial [Ruminococcus sp.]|nr:Rpn family recombination-promoting nuclease/putative transposase [Ruminococcus sp.]